MIAVVGLIAVCEHTCSITASHNQKGSQYIYLKKEEPPTVERDEHHARSLALERLLRPAPGLREKVRHA
jgi:hypothetical protein